MTTLHGIPRADWPTIVRVPRIVAEAMWPAQHDRRRRREQIRHVLAHTHGAFPASALAQAAAARAADDDFTDWAVYVSAWPDAAQAARAACLEAAAVLRAAEVDEAEREAYARWVLAVAAQIEKHWRESEGWSERATTTVRPRLEDLARALLGPGAPAPIPGEGVLDTPNGRGVVAFVAFIAVVMAGPVLLFLVPPVLVAGALWVAWRRWGRRAA